MSSPIEMNPVHIASHASQRPESTEPDRDSEQRILPNLPYSSQQTQAPSIELKPVLSERHVNMIAFSCCIGIGFFLQAGHVIYLAGPGMAIISYLLMGTVIWSAMACLGEMTALYPIKGPIFQFPCRFLDEGLGFAVGWMTWFAWVVIIAAELLAITQLFRFKFQDTYLEEIGLSISSLGYGPRTIGVDPAAWVFIFWLIILLVNFLPVRWYGEIEYVFGCVKMLFMVGLIMFNVIISAIGRGNRDHFWTYREPYGFISNNITFASPSTDGTGSVGPIEVEITGSDGRFLAVWTAMTTVLFSMIGFETVAITAAENKDFAANRSNNDHQEAIKIATRKISLRVIVLYTLCVFTSGLNVPYTDTNLRSFAVNSIRSGQYSIFVLAAVRNNSPGLAYFFNGFFIFSATSAGINSLYIASRMLHALASIDAVWPQWYVVQVLQRRLQTTRYGVPMASVFASWLFGSLAFLARRNDEPAQVLSNLATNSVVSMLIVYVVICASYIKFDTLRGKIELGQAGEGVDGVYGVEDWEQSEREKLDRHSPTYPYKSHLQWMRAYYALTGCLLAVLFLGWSSFLRPFHAGQFVAAYISIPVFGVLTLAYHVKGDKRDPREWSFWPSNEMANPATVVVEPPRKRKGKFDLPDMDGNPFTKDNAKSILEFVWTWMK